MDCPHGAKVTIDRIVLCDTCLQAARLGAFRRALAYCIAQVMNAGSASQQWMAKEWLAITDDQMRDILDGKTAILFDQKWPDA
jgi:hypothetical protein